MMQEALQIAEKLTEERGHPSNWPIEAAEHVLPGIEMAAAELLRRYGSDSSKWDANVKKTAEMYLAVQERAMEAD